MSSSKDDDVSLVLSKLLDSFGLDEDTRQRRMDIQKLNQLLLSWYSESIKGNKAVLLSGSSYETTTTCGLSSDIDVMFISQTINVIENIQQWLPDTATYMMDNTGCYPAFVKLYAMSPKYPGPVYSDMINNIPAGHVVDEDGKILYCNNALGKNLQRCFPFVSELHGPAWTVNITSVMKELDGLEMTGNIDIDTDCVIALKCKSFPKEAQHWKHRQTYDTRAKIGSAIIDQATHCYLVGVGNKGSPTENIEWRLSFSHIENQLVHAWNNVQYKCYVIMKFIHKDLIKPNVPDCILCSYHYKTTLMWMAEEYPVEFFIETNFGNCVLTILNNLSMCVKRKSLPHYFVKGCNLFYNKLDEESSKQIVSVIEKITGSWPYCLCNIERQGLGIALRGCLVQHVPLDNICKIQLQHRQQNFTLFDLFVDTYEQLHFFKHFQQYILNKRHTEVFKLLHNLVQRSKQKNFYYSTKNKQSVTFIVKEIICGIGLQLVNRSDTKANKAALHYKRLGLGCIQKCINNCCLDTQLQTAEYFFRVGKYHRALLLLDNVENGIKDYTDYSCDHSSCNNIFLSSHIRAVFDNKPSLMEYCKYYHAELVTYTQDNLPHVPRILVYEMFRTTVVSPDSPPVSFLLNDNYYNQAVIHCSVYLYYIRFLCFCALRRYAHRQVALDNIAWASKHLEISRCSHIETNYNILGDCFRSLGHLHRAYREYRKSLFKQKYHNAAIWHLALLLRKKITR